MLLKSIFPIVLLLQRKMYPEKRIEEGFEVRKSISSSSCCIIYRMREQGTYIFLFSGTIVHVIPNGVGYRRADKLRRLCHMGK